MTSTERAALNELLRWVTEDKGQTTASKLFELAWKLERERTGRGEFSTSFSWAIKDKADGNLPYWSHGLWTRNSKSATWFVHRGEALAVLRYLKEIDGPSELKLVRRSAPHNGAD